MCFFIDEKTPMTSATTGVLHMICFASATGRAILPSGGLRGPDESSDGIGWHGRNAEEKTTLEHNSRSSHPACSLVELLRESAHVLSLGLLVDLSSGRTSARIALPGSTAPA